MLSNDVILYRLGFTSVWLCHALQHPRVNNRCVPGIRLVARDVTMNYVCPKYTLYVYITSCVVLSSVYCVGFCKLKCIQIYCRLKHISKLSKQSDSIFRCSRSSTNINKILNKLSEAVGCQKQMTGDQWQRAWHMSL